MADLPLAGRVALVTGVSRAISIGPAIGRRLHAMGATVVATGWPAHDAEMPWGADEEGADEPGADEKSLGGDLPFAVGRHDLGLPETPGRLVGEVVEAHGSLDIVVATHARSSSGGLAAVDAAELDRCWAANVRSVVLLAQEFANVHVAPPADESPTGRMVWFTSGQHLQPMNGELAYAVSKGALHQMTPSVAKALSEYRIVANCINPGPVDTGYAPLDVHAQVASMFPDGRWGQPDDVADLVAFLVSDQGSWIRGQVLNTEGGFDRFV